MSEAQQLVAAARQAGFTIEDRDERRWWFEPHPGVDDILLHETRRGTLLLTVATGKGGRLRSVDDFALFRDDPEAFFRREVGARWR